MSDEIADSGNSLAEADLTPGEQWNRGSSDSLKQTKLGLNFVYFGIGLVVVSALVTVYLISSTDLPITTVRIIRLGVPVGYLMIFGGPLLCLAIPEESECRGLLFASVVCLSANLIDSGTNYFDPGYLTQSMMTFLKLGGNIGLILFVLFMEKLAIYINQTGLVGKVKLLFYLTTLILMGIWVSSLLEILCLISPSNPIFDMSGLMFVLVAFTFVLGELKEALAPSLNSNSTSESQNPE
ncbi:hypothetical protein [uncultured Gimesia sp.]|uniref:hypothetical protein n=1 Tax=uncultured Gimesia sp. TaxID=1678688 RepID=UPI002612A642|nr:hypothetical protein [uncultured Gimesia sp.]